MLVKKLASLEKRDNGTYSSCVQLEGLSIRWPSFNSLKSSSTGIPGYGEPPNVKISHIRTPKDQLWRRNRKEVRFALFRWNTFASDKSN